MRKLVITTHAMLVLTQTNEIAVTSTVQDVYRPEQIESLQDLIMDSAKASIISAYAHDSDQEVNEHTTELSVEFEKKLIENIFFGITQHESTIEAYLERAPEQFHGITVVSWANPLLINKKPCTSSKSLLLAIRLEALKEEEEEFQFFS